MNRTRSNNSTPSRCDARRRLTFNVTGDSCDDGGPSRFPRRAPTNQSYTIQRGTVSPSQHARCAPNLAETYDRTDDISDSDLTFANYSDLTDLGPSDITHGTYSVENPEECLQDSIYKDFASGVQTNHRSSLRFVPQHNVTQSICRVNDATFSQPRNACPSHDSQRSSRSPQAQLFSPPSGRRCPQSYMSYTPQRTAPRERRTQSGSRFRPPLERQANFDYSDECDIPINNSRRERSNISQSNRTASSRGGNVPNFSLASPRNEPVILDISHRQLENSNSRQPASMDSVSISLLSDRDSLHADLNNINNILNDDDFVDELIADLSQRSVNNSNRSNRQRSPRNIRPIRSPPQRNLGDGFGMQENRADQMDDIRYRNFQNIPRQMANVSLRDLDDDLRVRNMSPSANRRDRRNLHDESNLEQRGQRRNYEDGLVGYRSPQAIQRGQRRRSEISYQRGLRNLQDESDEEQRGPRNLHDESDLEDNPLYQRGLRRDLEDGLAMGNMSPPANQRGRRNLHDESHLDQMHQRRDFEDGLVRGVINLHDQSNQEQVGRRNLHDQSDQEQGGRSNLHDQSDQEQGGRRNLHDQSEEEQGSRRNLHDQRDQEQGGRRNLHDQSEEEQGGRRNLNNQSDQEQGGRRNLHDQSDQEQGGYRNLHDQSNQEQGGRINLHDQSDQEQDGRRNLHDQSEEEHDGRRNLHNQSDQEQGGRRNLHDQSDQEQGGRRNLHDQSDQEQAGRRNLHDESNQEQGGRRNLYDQSDQEQAGRRNLHDESHQEQGGRRNLHDQSDEEQGGRRNLHDQSHQEQGGRRNLHDQSDEEQGGRRNLHDQSDLEQGGNLNDQSNQEQRGRRNLHDQSDLEQGGPRNLNDESDLDDVPLCQRGFRRDLEDVLAAENVSPRANQRGQRNLHDDGNLEGGRRRNMSPRANQRGGQRNLNDSSLGDGFGRLPEGGQRQGAENVSINARMYRVMSPAANERRRRFEEPDADSLVPRNRQLMSPQANQRRCRFEKPGPSGLAMQNRQVYMSPPDNQRRPRNIHPISPVHQRPPRYIVENRLRNDLGLGNADISEEMLDNMIEDLIENISQSLENVQLGLGNVSLSPPRAVLDVSLSPPRQAGNASLSPPRQARNLPASSAGQAECMPFTSRDARNTSNNRSVALASFPPGNRAGPSQNHYPTNEHLITSLLRASANASGIAIPPPTGSPQRDIENLVAHGALDELTMSLVNISLSEELISGPNALLDHVSELSFINVSTESGEQQQFSILNESIRPSQNVSSLLGESPRMLQDESPLYSLNQGADELLRLDGADQGPWRVAVQYSPDGEQSAEEYNLFQRIIEDLGDQPNRGQAANVQHIEEFMAERSAANQRRFSPPKSSTPAKR